MNTNTTLSEKYQRLIAQFRSLAADDTRWLPLMANTCALLAAEFDDVSWVGFYLVTEGADGCSELSLGPFQGPLACVRIAWGKGVCGTAAATGQTQLVEDVEQFPGHIACDALSRSELVVPLRIKRRGKLRTVAVLDLDSHSRARFSQEDARACEALMAELGACVRFGSLSRRQRKLPHEQTRQA